MKTLAKWVVGVQDQLADLSVAFCSSLNIDIIVRRFCKKLNYRVFFTGPAPKSSKYGTGPAQWKKWPSPLVPPKAEEITEFLTAISVNLLQ